LENEINIDSHQTKRKLQKDDNMNQQSSDRCNMASKVLVKTSLAIAIGALFAPVHAQTAANPVELDQVVVSAQKRTQNLQAVPISIEAVSAADLEKAGIKDLFDLSQLSPSVTGGGDSRVAAARVGIRGISDFARNIGFDASVGVYVDGVFAGRQEGLSQSLLGIERIEVLRGPQGTLFGKNTVAGAISLTTRKPTQKFEGSSIFEIAENGSREAGVWVGGPIASDSLLGSLAVQSRKTDGYVKNVNLPDVSNNLGKGETKSVRTFARALVNPQLTIDVSLEALDLRGNPNFGEALEPTNQAKLAPGPWTTSTNLTTKETVKRTSGYLTVNYDLPTGHKLTSISASQNSESRVFNNDEDYTPFDIAETSLTATKTRQFTQEIRIASAPDPKQDWLAGLFYMSQLNNQAATIRTGSQFPSPGSPANAVFNGLLATQNPANLDTSTLAAFAHGNKMLTDDIQFTGGVRVTRETKKVDFGTTAAPQLAAAGIFPLARFQSELTDTDFSPKLGLNWFTSKNVMVFASKSRAFKSGGYNIDNVTSVLTDPANQLRYNKQNVDTMELGVKSELLDRRLRLNASVYSTVGSDYQVQQFIFQPQAPTRIAITNAGRVAIKGAEIDAVAKISAGFTIKGGLAFNDATFTDFKNGGGNGVNYDGNRLPFAPRLKSLLEGEYAFDVANYTIRSSLNVTHTSDQFSNSNNLAVNLIPSYKVVGARVSIEGGKANPWTLSLWGKNLTNEANLISRNVSFLGVNRGIYGAPRTLGVTLSVDL
jgi:iron complex outermembrane receptor protein